MRNNEDTTSFADPKYRHDTDLLARFVRFTLRRWQAAFTRYNATRSANDRRYADQWYAAACDLLRYQRVAFAKVRLH